MGCIFRQESLSSHMSQAVVVESREIKYYIVSHFVCGMNKYTNLCDVTFTVNVRSAFLNISCSN